jgi:hypothetical protein
MRLRPSISEFDPGRKPEMFFRSSKPMTLAVILFMCRRRPARRELVLNRRVEAGTDVSKREGATAGTLVRVEHGGSSTCEFLFPSNRVPVRGDARTCRMALTRAGCTQDAPVLVSYDPEQPAGARLEDFGARGRGKIFLGIWMVSRGLPLIGNNQGRQARGRTGVPCPGSRRGIVNPIDSRPTEYSRLKESND